MANPSTPPSVLELTQSAAGVPTGLIGVPGPFAATLTWTTADGDVQSYAIYRDGVLVGSSPYPSYLDLGLEANRAYSYTVRSVDSSGRESLDSEPVTVTPDRILIPQTKFFSGVLSSADPVTVLEAEAPIGGSSQIVASATTTTTTGGNPGTEGQEEVCETVTEPGPATPGKGKETAPGQLKKAGEDRPTPPGQTKDKPGQGKG